MRGATINTATGKLRLASFPRQQLGMTMLGFLILAVFVGLIAFGAIRLTPVYLNYMKVVGIVEGVHAEFDGQNATRNDVRRSIARRIDVESVEVISARDISVTPVSGGLEVAAVYDHTTPFLSNVSFTVHFDKRSMIRR